MKKCKIPHLTHAFLRVFNLTEGIHCSLGATAKWMHHAKLMDEMPVSSAGELTATIEIKDL